MNRLAIYNGEWPKLIITIAAMILAIDPLIWFFKSWFDPSYASSGFYLFIPLVAIFSWSISSTVNKKTAPDFPIILLLCSALIRLISQLLAINIIGALTLVVDVFAIAKLCGLDKRTRSISPFWLAISFAFTLPLERVLQRVLGYGLQNVSADGACMVLQGVFDNVSCLGTRILINAQDVMVDLPCSGARSLLVLLFFFSIAATIVRFNPVEAIKGVLITIVTAYFINVIRICILSVGIGFPNLMFDIDVMSQPAHDIIGLLMLSFGGMPIILWAKCCYRPDVQQLSAKSTGFSLSVLARKISFERKFLLSLCFFAVTCLIVSVPKNAVDVATKNIRIELPVTLNGSVATPLALTEQEQNYFTQYGGSAKKATYGDSALLMVRTSAPLRHLHAPDDCLRGMGLDVEYVGIDYSLIPTAIYKATDEQGTSYRVAVSFISSENKLVTTNVSEAVWHWIKNPSENWTAIQRVSNWNAPNVINFDRAVMTSLNIPTNSIQLAHIKE